MSERVESAMMYVTLLTTVIHMIQNPASYTNVDRTTICATLEEMKNHFKQVIMGMMMNEELGKTPGSSKGGMA